MKEYLVWYWSNDNRICGTCGWLVLAEKNYYWCTGCEKTVDKPSIQDMFKNGFIC